MKYKVYGKILDSDVSFWQLAEEPGEGKADFFLWMRALPERVKEHIAANKGPSGRGEDFYWFNTPGGYFAILGGKEIVTQETEPERLEKMKTYLLGYGLSMLFYENDEMAVHCSAVAHGDDCLLLSGYSGAGKSTLAGRFLERGWKLMADDVAVISRRGEELVTEPAFPVRKLCRDVAMRAGHDLDQLIYVDEDKDKYAIRCPEAFAGGPARVKAMFVITPYDGLAVRLQELTGEEKLQTFLENLFLHVIFRKEGMAPEKFFRCLEMLSQLPLYRLYRPLQGGDSSLEMAELATDIALER